MPGNGGRLSEIARAFRRSADDDAAKRRLAGFYAKTKPFAPTSNTKADKTVTPNVIRLRRCHGQRKRPLVNRAAFPNMVCWSGQRRCWMRKDCMANRVRRSGKASFTICCPGQN